MPLKISDMSNFPAKMMPQNWILYNFLRTEPICFNFFFEYNNTTIRIEPYYDVEWSTD